MGQLFDAVVEYLNEDEWSYHVVREDAALMLAFRGESGSWQCYGTVDEDKGWFSFYSILPSVVPEEKRADVAEFITRANYGSVIGNFEMDYNDGEVRYKTSIDVEGGDLTPKMVENVIRTNWTMMDRYFPGLMAVLYADCDPAEAVAEVEEQAGHPQDDDLDDLDFGEDDEDEEGNGFPGGPEDGEEPPS